MKFFGIQNVSQMFISLVGFEYNIVTFIFKVILKNLLLFTITTVPIYT